MKLIQVLIFPIMSSMIILSCATPKTDVPKIVTGEKKLEVAKSAIVRLTDEYVQETLTLDPFWAPTFGDEKFYSEFGDPLAEENIAKSKALVDAYLKKLHALSKKDFNEYDKDTYKIFESDLKTAQLGFKFPIEQMPFNQMDSRFRDFVKQGNGERFPFKTVRNYEDFLKRATGFKVWAESAKKQMRKGMSQGVTLNREIAKTVAKQLDDYVVSDVTKSDFYKPIMNFPKEI